MISSDERHPRFRTLRGLVAVGSFDLLADEAFGGYAVNSVGIEPHAGLNGGGGSSVEMGVAAVNWILS